MASTNCIPKDAYQYLMLHPYITATRTSSQNLYTFSDKDPSIYYYVQLRRVWLMFAYD